MEPSSEVESADMGITMTGRTLSVEINLATTCIRQGLLKFRFLELRPPNLVTAITFRHEMPSPKSTRFVTSGVFSLVDCILTANL